MDFLKYIALLSAPKVYFIMGCIAAAIGFGIGIYEAVKTHKWYYIYLIIDKPFKTAFATKRVAY